MAPWQEKQIADPKFDRILPLPGEVFCVNGHEAYAIYGDSDDRYDGQYCAGAGDVDFLRPEKI